MRTQRRHDCPAQPARQLHRLNGPGRPIAGSQCEEAQTAAHEASSGYCAETPQSPLGRLGAWAGRGLTAATFAVMLGAGLAPAQAADRGGIPADRCLDRSGCVLEVIRFKDGAREIQLMAQPQYTTNAVVEQAEELVRLGKHQAAYNLIEASGLRHDAPEGRTEHKLHAVLAQALWGLGQLQAAFEELGTAGAGYQPMEMLQARIRLLAEMKSDYSSKKVFDLLRDADPSQSPRETRLVDRWRFESGHLDAVLAGVQLVLDRDPSPVDRSLAERQTLQALIPLVAHSPDASPSWRLLRFERSLPSLFNRVKQAHRAGGAFANWQTVSDLQELADAYKKSDYPSLYADLLVLEGRSFLAGKRWDLGEPKVKEALGRFVVASLLKPDSGFARAGAIQALLIDPTIADPGLREQILAPVSDDALITMTKRGLYELSKAHRAVVEYLAEPGNQLNDDPQAARIEHLRLGLRYDALTSASKWARPMPIDTRFGRDLATALEEAGRTREAAAAFLDAAEARLGMRSSYVTISSAELQGAERLLSVMTPEDKARFATVVDRAANDAIEDCVKRDYCRTSDSSLQASLRLKEYLQPETRTKLGLALVQKYTPAE